MAGAPDRSFSFGRNDERSLQYQAYQPNQYGYNERDVSPVEERHHQYPSSNDIPPPPPMHRDQYSSHPQHGVTPGADNFSEGAAGGGINGVALGVANSHERESGAQALRDIDNWGRNGDGLAGPRGIPMEQSNSPYYHGNDYAGPSQAMHTHTSHSSNHSDHSNPFDSRHALPYSDNPYNRYSSGNLNVPPAMGEINPNEIADDDDYGIAPVQQNRKSFFGGSSKAGSQHSVPAAAAAGAGVAAGAGAFAATRDASGQYNAVPGGAGAGEKSEWLAKQGSGNKRLKWIVGIIIVIVVIGAIVAGVLAGVVFKPKDSSSSGGGKSGSQSVAEDNRSDLDLNSKDIKALMNNKNLHKVFPGMDYTPLNAQYPDCIKNPPSQNNVTRDMAVLSQLTNAVRLYGTDCNQTEMVLHAIDKLQLKDMKVWLGVWLGNNGTTNDRQLDLMHKILDNNDASKFKGIIIGNEVLFRKDLTQDKLLEKIKDVKDDLSKKKINLPVATSDLGDNWTADMASKVDIVMSNVHPFFAGVAVDKAAGWTWDFWTGHDVVLTKSNANIKQIIAEVGWPSGGGNDCGDRDCTNTSEGSVASVDNMNKFMEDWVCPSLKNGTEYFWFEAFDEPWKVQFNEKGKEWEDKWGLMDIDRNLKKGLKIPDCGGQSAS